MNWDIYGRYFLELMICLPAALICLAPVRDRLRMDVRAFVACELAVMVLFALVGAAIGMATMWPCNYIIFPAMLVFYALYWHLVDLERLKALFIYFTAAATMGFVAVFNDVVMARIELAETETLPTLLSAGVQFGLGLLFVAITWPVMARHVSWLVCRFEHNMVWRIAWMLPAVFLAMSVILVPQDYNTMLVNRVQPLGAVLMLFLLLLMVFLIELLYRIARSLSDSAALREENHLLAAQASQYAALSNYINKTRKLRHDFRQHLRVLSGLVSKGDLKGIEQYLSEVDVLAQDEDVKFIFANPALNALAGYYESCARVQGVELDWQVSMPRETGMPDAEICVLLGNLLENALDGAAMRPEGERRVRVICRMNGELMCAIVENTCSGLLRREGGRFASTKHDGAGYGLSSVEAAVARHRGTMSIDAEDGMFRVNLMLNLPAQSE